MKATEKDKPIHTIPKGVWESSHPDNKKEKNGSPAVDLQGNGYPDGRQDK